MVFSKGTVRPAGSYSYTHMFGLTGTGHEDGMGNPPDVAPPLSLQYNAGGCQNRCTFHKGSLPEVLL